MRVAATGSLCNLTVMGGEEVVDELVKEDVLSPLLVVLENSHKLISSELALQEEQQQSSTNSKLTENATHFLALLQQSSALLLNLCEIRYLHTYITSYTSLLTFVLHSIVRML